MQLTFMDQASIECFDHRWTKRFDGKIFVTCCVSNEYFDSLREGININIPQISIDGHNYFDAILVIVIENLEHTFIRFRCLNG